jgi:anaerobic dimethyl sulfoxide reductase subunit B (iron-sulfur subunit)
VSSTTTTPIAQGKQYGFFFDQSRCIGCAGCVLACMGTKQLLHEDHVKLLHLFQWETGTFPNVRLNRVWAPCYHCANPVCVTAAKGALIKEPGYGAVLIDPDKATSSDLKAAWEACPYGAISFDSDSPTSTAFKCDMCIDRLMVGNFPSCVLACPTRALDFGPIDELAKKYGTNQQLNEMPSSSTTTPAVVFKPMADKNALVPYDANTAIQLLANRGGSLPPFYGSVTDVTQVPAGTISRASLSMKASGKDLILRTTDDSK